MTQKEMILHSIKSNECVGCYCVIKKANPYDSPFCSNRCSIYFIDHAPLDLVGKVFAAYNKFKSDGPLILNTQNKVTNGK